MKAVLERDKPPSTFLFTGPSGCGKTTLSRIVADSLGCEPMEFKEINASDDTGIDSIRRLRDDMKLSPLAGDKKVILLDEAHMLTKNSQEALLKILEEPPSYVHLIIATTNPEALKPTFKRRCHQYDLSALSPKEILTLIKKTLVSEKKDISKFPKAVAEMIVELSEGSPGQAMKLLDMVIDMSDKEQMLESIKNSGMVVATKEVIDICRILISDSSSATKWMRISEILKELKTDGENARRPILGYFQTILLSKKYSEAEPIARIMSCFTDNYFNSGKAGLSLSCLLACENNGE